MHAHTDSIKTECHWHNSNGRRHKGSGKDWTGVSTWSDWSINKVIRMYRHQKVNIFWSSYV